MSSYDILTEAKSKKGIFRPLSLVHVHMNRVAREGRHSTTSFSANVVPAKTVYQMLEVLSFCDRERV